MNLDTIKKTIELYSMQDLTVKSRKQNVIYLRAIYYKIARELTACSLEQIGFILDKNHATVLHGLNQFESVLKTPYYRNLYNEIKEALAEEDLNRKSAIVNNTLETEENNNEIWKLKSKIRHYETAAAHPIFNELLSLTEDQLTEFNETRLKPFKKALESRVLPKVIQEMEGYKWSRDINN